MGFRRLVIFLSLLATGFLVACGGGGGGSNTNAQATLQSVVVSAASPSFAVGASQQVSATGTYSDDTTQDLTADVTWSSSDADVATVDAAGLVTGVGTGTVTLTATSGDVSGSVDAAVTAAPLASITLAPGNFSIAKGYDRQLTATGSYTDGSSGDISSTVIWSSSNTAIATIDADGLMTGVAVGQATLSATAGDLSASLTVTVTDASLVSISLAPNGFSAPLGLSQQLTATGTFSDDTTQDLSGDVTWSSSNTNVATVSSAGLVATHAMGQATVTATSGTVSDAVTVTVTAVALMSIDVTPADFSVAQGHDQQLTATGNYSDGTTQDVTASVTWSSSDATLISVSDTAGTKGLASFVKMGLPTITATDAASGVSGSVTPAVHNVMFVTSATGSGMLSTWTDSGGQNGLAGADSVCQAEAAAAGLDGTFKAWLSDGTDDAYCRIAGHSGKMSANCGQAALPTAAGPWVRTDGHPFSETLDQLTDSAALLVYAIHTPPRLDASGNAVPDADFAMTATQHTGDLYIPGSGVDQTCSNWSSAAAGVYVAKGMPHNTARMWSVSHFGAGCSGPYHMYCLQTGSGPALPALPITGKKVFATTATGTGDLSSWADAGGQTGVAAGDAICQAHASAAGLANAANFKAWLSTTVVNAKDRFVNTSGPYVSVDGVKVADDMTALTSGSVFSPISRTELNEVSWGAAWTGTQQDGTVSTNTCADWTDGVTGGVTGRVGALSYGSSSWTSHALYACTNSFHLYCVED